MNWHLFDSYRFDLSFAGSIYFILSVFTIIIIGLFSLNYLEAERGRLRFWVLFTLFGIGIITCSVSANLETMFLGWEMVGWSSFFLIGFYPSNSRALENSLIALANYKMGDIFFVLAIFLQGASTPQLLGLCLVLATLAKSAQYPFSSWLYRALEGPTPSSTIFYGGLSLHLGPFLLLQYAHLWDGYIWLRVLVGFIGGFSAIYGFLVGSTRHDLKTSFAFAAISQVGLIYMELAFGLYGLALWHIVGHNLLRTWNYLRAGSFFDDFFFEFYHQGHSFVKKGFSVFPRSFYFHSLNGFYLDRLFIWMRNTSLLFIYIAALYFVVAGSAEGNQRRNYLLLLVALLLTAKHFFKDDFDFFRQFVQLLLSQTLLLISLHNIYVDEVEEVFFFSSLLAMLGIVYSLWPAIKIWLSNRKMNSPVFLGLSYWRPYRNILFIFSALSVTAAPGSVQFFLQEHLFNGLWGQAHSYMFLSLCCISINSYHFFRLGQYAFLGESSSQDFSPIKII